MSDKTVTVHVKDIGTFSLPVGMNLRQGLRREGIYLDGTCSDQGRCGRCVVRVMDGDSNEPGDLERRLLGKEAIAEGRRLACKMNLQGDLSVAIDEEAILELDRTGRWKETWGSPLWDGSLFTASNDGYGISVDLGTTSIASALFNLSESRPMDIVSSANPQAPWGQEILSRLSAASGDGDIAVKLQDLLLETISTHLRRLCSRNGISTRSISRMVLVGNSAMHHLVLGLDVSSLLTVPYSPSQRGAKILSPSEVYLKADLNPDMELIFPSLVDGFIGSDLTSSLLAARAAGKGCGILMDTGTNSEVAVWKDDRVLTSSAAAGPAFEGGHIRCGMRADEGAIYKVALKTGGLDYEVIGGGAPVGICGTGILDIVAEMVRWDLIDRTGRVRKDAHPCLRGNILVLDKDLDIVFEPADVEAVQKAKAALSVVPELLMKRLGVEAGQVDVFYLAGAFGGRFDPANARAIGLLPPLLTEKFVMAGNAALVGASFILLSHEAERESSQLADSVEYISLADDPEFEELYLENLFFK